MLPGASMPAKQVLHGKLLSAPNLLPDQLLCHKLLHDDQMLRAAPNVLQHVLDLLRSGTDLLRSGTDLLHAGCGF